MGKTRITGIILFLILCVSGYISGQSIDEISFVTEHYPPYNFIKNERLQGISVDLLTLMFERSGSSQSRDDIKLLPWARGYYYALNAKNYSLFSTTRTTERENKFKWVGPITSTTISLSAKKERGIIINTIDDAKQYTIGSVIEGVGEQLLIKEGININKLIRNGGVDVLFNSIRMLNSGMIDIFAYEENVFRWEIKERGFIPDLYETVFVLKKGYIYYAFNKETPDSVIIQLQNALDELKKDGTHQKILDNYIK